MYIDLSPRRGGKTYRLLRWIEKDPRRLLITFNEKTASYLKQEYRHLASQIISWPEYMRSSTKNPPRTEIAIDNAELILEGMVRHQLKIITLSNKYLEEAIFPEDLSGDHARPLTVGPHNVNQVLDALKKAAGDVSKKPMGILTPFPKKKNNRQGKKKK